MTGPAVAIRERRAGDAPGMAAVYERAVRTTGARDYSLAQIEAWIGDPSALATRLEARTGDGRRCWVAVDSRNEVKGFADLEADGHIDFLYVDPDLAGRGVAAMLLDVLEAAAADVGIGRLYVEASEAARRFFTRRGFAAMQRRDFEVGGVAIHNYLMEKRFS